MDLLCTGNLLGAKIERMYPVAGVPAGLRLLVRLG